MFVYIDISRLFACVHYKAVFLAFFFFYTEQVELAPCKLPLGERQERGA